MAGALQAVLRVPVGIALLDWRCGLFCTVPTSACPLSRAEVIDLLGPDSDDGRPAPGGRPAKGKAAAVAAAATSAPNTRSKRKHT